MRHYDDALPRVQSDPLLLHQVFLNIVMNAEQAIAGTGGPGRIDVTTLHDTTTNRIVATVRDSGHGIPEDALTRIFEPFYTTKDVGKGTGLGPRHRLRDHAGTRWTDRGRQSSGRRRDLHRRSAGPPRSTGRTRERNSTAKDGEA